MKILLAPKTWYSQKNKNTINENKKIQIVFEAGPTHNGFKSAKKLIFSAAISGADAIKFQIIDADEIMADKN